MPVPANYRWLFEDPESNLADYRVALNPNKMTSPFKPTNLDTLPGTNGRLRTLHQKSGAQEWTFSGVIRELDHFTKLVAFAACQNHIYITDHLGRQWDVVPTHFDAREKRPSVRVPDKYDYDFTVLVLGRLA